MDRVAPYDTTAVVRKLPAEAVDLAAQGINCAGIFRNPARFVHRNLMEPTVDAAPKRASGTRSAGTVQTAPEGSPRPTKPHTNALRRGCPILWLFETAWLSLHRRPILHGQAAASKDCGPSGNSAKHCTKVSRAFQHVSTTFAMLKQKQHVATTF